MLVILLLLLVAVIHMNGCDAAPSSSAVTAAERGPTAAMMMSAGSGFLDPLDDADGAAGMQADAESLRPGDHHAALMVSRGDPRAGLVSPRRLLMGSLRFRYVHRRRFKVHVLLLLQAVSSIQCNRNLTCPCCPSDVDG